MTCDIPPGRRGRSWRGQYSSICDAPVQPTAVTTIAPDHPARVFGVVWHGLADGAPPDRRAFCPSLAPPLLRWLMLLEFQGAGTDPRFFIRVQGSACAVLTNGDISRRYLDEIVVGPCYESRKAILTAVRDSQTPAHAHIRAAAVSASDFSTTVDVGFYPFLGEGDAVDFVMVVPAPVDPDLRGSI